MKIKLKQQMSPLTISLKYLSLKPSQKAHVYLSYDAKEPSAQSNQMRFVNPSKIQIEGTIKDKRLGKTFAKEWLYISVVSD